MEHGCLWRAFLQFQVFNAVFLQIGHTFFSTSHCLMQPAWKSCPQSSLPRSSPSTYSSWMRSWERTWVYNPPAHLYLVFHCFKNEEWFQVMQKHLQATLQPYFPKQYYVMAVTTARKLRKMHLPEFQGTCEWQTKQCSPQNKYLTLANEMQTRQQTLMHIIYNDAGNLDKSLHQVLLLSSFPLKMINSCMVSNSEFKSILELSRVLIGLKEIKGVGIWRITQIIAWFLVPQVQTISWWTSRLARMALFTFEDLVVLPDNFTTSDVTCSFTLCSIKYILIV